MLAGSHTDPLVVATFGRRVELALPGGNRVSARIRGRKLKPVCADRVLAEPLPNEDDWLVTGIRPRENELARPDSRGRIEVLAANLSLVVVVAAALPRPDWFIVDRYLAAAEFMAARALVVWNKTDLAEAGASLLELADYEKIGYPVARTSAESAVGLDDLRACLAGETAVLVGQSGVGKSSLINRLLPSTPQRTAEVSGKTGDGRHTTVNSSLMALPAGGAVIDSPGVRDYAPAVDSPARVVVGFREIATAGVRCKYANCRHLREPGCAVKSAVDAGDISGRRYESYRRLLRLTEDFARKF